MVNGQGLSVQPICHTKPYNNRIFKLMALRDTLVYESDNQSTANFASLFPVVCFVFVSGQALQDCCRLMRLQMLNFHAVFKMWSSFQNKGQLFHSSLWHLTENRHKQCNQRKDILTKILRGLHKNNFTVSQLCCHCSCFLKMFTNHEMGIIILH